MLSMRHLQHGHLVVLSHYTECCVRYTCKTRRALHSPLWRSCAVELLVTLPVAFAAESAATYDEAKPAVTISGIRVPKQSLIT